MEERWKAKLLLAVLAILGLVAGPAGAAEVGGPLRADPVTASVAGAHERVVLVELTFVASDGSPTHPDGQPATRGIVEGNCGSAFLFLFADGPMRIGQEWGLFDLAFRATAYSWDHVVSGPAGFTRSESGAGALRFRRAWSGTDGFPVPANGRYTGIASMTATNGIQTCTGSATDVVAIG